MFEIIPDSVANVIHFSVPDTADSIDIDRLIDGVLSALAGKANLRWVLDFGGVSYVGSSILGLMVNVRERIRQGSGILVLCGLSPSLLRTFHTSALDRLFTVKRTREDALAFIRRQ